SSSRDGSRPSPGQAHQLRRPAGPARPAHGQAGLNRPRVGEARRLAGRRHQRVRTNPARADLDLRPLLYTCRLYGILEVRAPAGERRSRGRGHQGGAVMSRPRRRLFGPLTYSTLVLALLVAIYDVVLNAPQWLEGASKALDERRAVRSLA